ncbi:uroporphyrinogen-III synthase [Parvibaculum sp.]|uniref:uroporphyrinogen-III synthase n=1 Tax=Parvibaculum sp. TaxID=2024848 RepID=UPI002BE26F54|nr:uroporphyrinogen-III synthase [Parvibaculum sp.]HUD53168.1 uroporphyrinogen-III synthase [Parvibaculum sp.]
MRLLVTRPDEDQDGLAEALRAMGHQAIAAPLLAIRPLADAAIPDTPYQALLVTSANGARAVGARRRDMARLAALPVLAVGEASAEAARAAGFADVASAGGDVEALIELALRRLAPGGGPLLHVAGSVTAGDLKGGLEAHGFSVDRVALYEAVAADCLPEAAIEALGTGAADGVLFYSPRTARSFASLIRAAGLEQTLVTLTAYCLSGAVADALAGLPFKAIETATEPTQAALLGRLA